jgi:CBS domain-containing protein
MSASPLNAAAKPGTPSSAPEEFQLLFFSEILKRRICAGKISQKVGRVTDLVFKLSDPYPEAVGIHVEHGGGHPNEFVPWDKVVKIEEDAIFITRTEGGGPYPPFVDQKGWILLNEHLMGRTILDMDGRRTEVVNDVHLLYSKGRMIVVHVDTSFNGFLRKWGLRRLISGKDRFISWRYVQPLSLEDAGATDAVSLSVTRKQIKGLPTEDLADALETLSGKEQEAVFSALDSNKAAEVLVEAEPRAQRQLIANVRREKARTILSEMSVPQLADLFSVLPHDQMIQMMGLLPPDRSQRIRAIISDREATARALMSATFLTATKETSVGEMLKRVRASKHEHDTVSYVYIVAGDDNVLVGVVDLRAIVLADDDTKLGDIMVSPVVSAQQDDVREGLADLFAKYHYRTIPVVDAQDRLQGVVHYNDIMRGLVTRARA